MQKTSPFKLSLFDSIELANMPLGCIGKEYPNKLNQVLGDSLDLGTPSELHPVFYGCFDWHSAVHAHWTLLALMRLHPQLDQRGLITERFQHLFTKKNIDKEIAYFERTTERSFERTYGWAWLLKLQEELDKTQFEEIKENLRPLSELIIQRYFDFLPKLTYPIRTGEHSNTAFGLSLAYDYAITLKDTAFRNMIEDTAMRLFSDDKNCPINWEPSGFDFLSPCLEEANLMAKIMTKEKFEKWIIEFMPQLLNDTFELNPAVVTARTDGKLAHLDGLNFSRAWCLKRIGLIVNRSKLIELSNLHIDFSKRKIADGNYSGDHWLASFLTLASLPQ